MDIFFKYLINSHSPHFLATLLTLLFALVVMIVRIATILFHCLLYHEDRTRLFVNFSLIRDLELTCKTLLFGSEDLDLDAKSKILEIVPSYIESFASVAYYL